MLSSASMEINGMLMGVESWGGYRTEKPSSGSEELDRGQLALPCLRDTLPGFLTFFFFLQKGALFLQMLNLMPHFPAKERTQVMLRHLRAGVLLSAVPLTCHEEALGPLGPHLPHLEKREVRLAPLECCPVHHKVAGSIPGQRIYQVVQSPTGCIWKATDRCFSNGCFSFSPSLLSKIKLKKHKKLREVGLEFRNV